MLGNNANRIKKIEERCKSSTPGPWRKNPKEDIVCLDGRERNSISAYGAGVICGMSNDEDTHNWEFIAHSREDIPWLLDEITRLTTKVEALERAARMWCCHATCTNGDTAWICGETRCRNICLVEVSGDWACTNWHFDYERFAGGGRR